MTGPEHDDGTVRPGSDDRGPGDGRPDSSRTTPSRPHENTVRVLLSDPARVLALFRDHLPNEIAGLLADTPPVPVDGTFVDEALRDSQSDFLFEVTLRNGAPAFIYVLIEHKSRPDPATPLQLAGYMVRIWQRHAQGAAERLRALPPIVPMVLYHGEERWSVPDGIGEMIAPSDPALVFLPGARFILRNLRGLPTEALSRDPVLRSGFIVLTGRAVAHMDTIVEGLGPETPVLQRQIAEYILAVYPDADLERLMEALQAVRTGPLEAMVGTIAERLRQEGRIEGLQAGEALGLQKGEALGLEKGEALGLEKGEALGLEKGEALGLEKGEALGLEKGEALGLEKGEALGIEKGEALGLEKGEALGLEKGEALGLEKGEALGLEKATARSLTQLLVHRFGPLPDEIAVRIAASDSGQLELWFEAALDAPSREAVFDDDTR